MANARSDMTVTRAGEERQDHCCVLFNSHFKQKKNTLKIRRQIIFVPNEVQKVGGCTELINNTMFV